MVRQHRSARRVLAGVATAIALAWALGISGTNAEHLSDVTYEFSQSSGPVGTHVAAIHDGDFCEYVGGPAPFAVYLGPTLVHEGETWNCSGPEFTFTVPVGSTLGPKSVYVCDVEDVCDLVGTFTVTAGDDPPPDEEEAIALSPTGGPIGRSVTATVTGWTPNTDVTIWFFLQTVGQGVANSDGIAVIQFTVPTWAIVGEDSFVEACSHPVECQETLADDYADADFLVTEPPTVPPTTPPTTPPTVPPTVPPTTVPEPVPFFGCPEAELSGAKNLVLIAHGWMPPWDNNPTWHRTMKADITARLGAAAEDWDVIAYDWTGPFGAETGPIPGLAKTNAGVVGDCLGRKLAAKEWDAVHLIGHSAGSWLVDAVSMHLSSKSEYVQVTLLDAYTPFSNVGVSTLGSSADFAEHYVDTRPVIEFGPIEIRATDQRLQKAYNVVVTRLDPTWATDDDGHGWPIDWYQSTIADPPANPGPSDRGFSRSPENNQRPTYEGKIQQDGCIWYESNGTVHDCGDSKPPAVVTSSSLDLSNVQKSPSGVVTSGLGSITLKTTSPAWAQLELNAGSNQALAFDLRFVSPPSAGGWFQLTVDGVPLLLLKGDELATTDAQPYEIALPASTSPQTLAFRLDETTSAPAAVEVTNVRLVTFTPGEPPTLIDGNVSTPTPTSAATPAATPTATTDAPDPPNTGTGTAGVDAAPIIGGTLVFGLATFLLVAGGRWAVRGKQR